MKKATVSGRLGQPIELKHVGENSTPLAEFDIAIREWNHKEKKEDTVWFPVQAWGQQAEFIANYASVGDTIIAHGELIVDTWESQKYTDEEGNGARFRKTLVKADLGMLELVKKGEGGEGAGTKKGTRGADATTVSIDDEDDVPF